MACKNVCKLCDKLILSTAVAFSAATGLLIYIPAGTYANGEKYCIVVAQPIPAATTVNANVSIIIGTGTTQYPLMDCECAQVTACAINTRTKYSTRVVTTPTGGSFKLIGKVNCSHETNNLPSLPVA